MARSPPKLKSLLLERGVPESTITDNLVLVEGDSTDTSAVKKVLLYRDQPVSLIVCGVGGRPFFDTPLTLTIDNPRICQDTVGAILEAARTLDTVEGSYKPTLIAISSTGISDTARDVPWIMVPPSRWLLKVPHADKKVMERRIQEDMQKDDTAKGIQNYTIVRPSWFTAGEGTGLQGVRVGVDDAPAVGYTISRNDVGRWIFENLIRRENKYLGQAVSITT